MKKFSKLLFKLFLSILLAFGGVSGQVLAEPEDEVVTEAGEASEDLEEGSSEEGEDESDPGKEETQAPVTYDSRGWPSAPENLASGSIYMIETNTGAVLYSKDPEKDRYPASTTKLMTALLALENCSMNETVTFSKEAVDLEDGASSIGAVAGEQMPMKDVLYGLMLPSGNECANAIAEHIAGSVEAFAEMMTSRAKELGCEKTTFMNPHGLFNSNHSTSAYDLALIAKEVFNNSAFCEIVSHASYTIGPTNMNSSSRTITNTNQMIIPNSPYYNEYVIGGKTGYLYEAGRCLVTMAKKDGMSIITVCLYCPDYNGVFDDTNELLDYAFKNFEIRNIVESEKRFNFAEDSAKVTIGSAGQVLMPVRITNDQLGSEIEFTYDMNLEEFNAASEEAGIERLDGRHLYALVNYSYNGNYLGHVNVIIDDNLVVEPVEFKKMTYISVWYFIIGGAVIVLIIIIFLIIAAEKRAAARRAKYGRKTKRKKTTQSADRSRQSSSNRSRSSGYNYQRRR